jgi:protein-S-isoprenylcysteine O-methyltransferase Ste14
MSQADNEKAASPVDRSRLLRIVLSRAVFFYVFIALIFFVPAGTTAYWQAGLFLAVTTLPVTYTMLYLWKHDPELLERRMRAREKEPAQKTIQKVAFVGFIVTYLLPGFDKRFGWSSVPAELVLIADAVVVLGYLLFIVVVRKNRYASRIIEVRPGQTVVSSGAYAIVRHPMYSGVLALYTATPLALGSYWGIIGVPLVVVPLIARILNEEEMLTRRLEGYAEYMQKTRFRLIPGIW